MPLFFEFKLAEHGWADAVFGDEVGRANLTASYLSDALGDLVRAVHSALIGTDLQCSWDAEPEEYRWCFSRIGDTTTVAVLGFEDASAELPRQYGNVLFKATEPAIEITRAIEQGARSVLDEFGMDGYERRWERHPFPRRDLDQLRAAIQTVDAGGSVDRGPPQLYTVAVCSWRVVQWHATRNPTKSAAFQPTSKRRFGYPSETNVKRGVRVVHGDKELQEKLGRNDPCICGSGRRF